jgi:hypothetical protein
MFIFPHIKTTAKGTSLPCRFEVSFQSNCVGLKGEPVPIIKTGHPLSNRWGPPHLITLKF